jgi:hypothetical protein
MYKSEAVKGLKLVASACPAHQGPFGVLFPDAVSVFSRDFFQTSLKSS